MKLIISKLLVCSVVVSLMAPAFVLAQTSAAAIPPTFMDAVKTADDWDALTAEQQAEIRDFMAASGPGQVSTVTAPEGTVSCFDYYTFGSVKVNVQGSVAETVSGVPFSFTGTIDNENTYPVVDGAIYMKIFRLPHDGVMPVNGYDVVAQGFVEEGLVLPANGSIPISFAWDIPAALPSGQYQAAFFFTSAHRFNLLGLPFTDDVVGNTVSFAVAGELVDTVAFQKDAVTVAGNEYYFAAFTPKVTAADPVAVNTVLKNDTKESQTVPVTITTYAWDQQRAQNVVSTRTISVAIEAGQTTEVSEVVTDTSSSVYLVVFESTYLDTKSILNVRFTRTDIPSVRINFPAVLSYPLKDGQETTLFSCLHAAGTLPVVPDGKLILTLKDEAGVPFHTYSYEGDITGAMMGVAEKFTPTRDYATFTLTAALYRGEILIDTVDMTYDCTALGERCTTAPVVTSETEAASTAGVLMKFFAIGLTFLILMSVVLKIFIRPKVTKSAQSTDYFNNSTNDHLG